MEDDDGDSSGSARKKRDMGKKRKRPPELRDPNSPKRATSAYVFFCHEMRRKIRSGEIKKAATISRTISDAWANLTSSEKQVTRGRKFKSHDDIIVSGADTLNTNYTL